MKSTEKVFLRTQTHFKLFFKKMKGYQWTVERNIPRRWYKFSKFTHWFNLWFPGTWRQPKRIVGYTRNHLAPNTPGFTFWRKEFEFENCIVDIGNWEWAKVPKIQWENLRCTFNFLWDELTNVSDHKTLQEKLYIKSCKKNFT